MADEQTGRYARMGADGDEEGMYVRFQPGMGLNVYIGRRQSRYTGPPNARTMVDVYELAMSIDGWEQVCGFVDQWRAREAAREATTG